MSNTTNFISFDAIRKNFNGAMEKLGYYRATLMCQKWGITNKQLYNYFQKGYDCDTFIVEGTRYIHKDAQNPKEVNYGEQR